MLFRILVTSLLLAAARDPKPACTAENVGMFWPDAANRDRKLLKKMAHCGELEVCTRARWRYRWESPTVRIDQLRGGANLAKPTGCEAAPAAGSRD